MEEYYNAEQLYQAGYNIVRPLRTIREGGQQMVIYPVVHWPVMFDLMREVEVGNAEEGSYDILVSAEKHECGRLLDMYQSTFAHSTAAEHARAPIHQLFWHRLVGGRFKSFYEGKLIQYPQGTYALGDGISFNELLSLRWVINGVSQQKTLGELVECAKVVLYPAQDALTVIGHGDAHFGNVFLENARLHGGRPLAPIHLANAAGAATAAQSGEMQGEASPPCTTPLPPPTRLHIYEAVHLNYNGLNVALSSLFKTLPMSVFGRLSRNSINFGTLYGVNSFLQYAMI